MGAKQDVAWPANAIRPTVCDMVPVPLFTMEEIARLTPDEVLARVRGCHLRAGRLAELARLDREVAERGNPYVPRVIWPRDETHSHER